MENLKVIKKIDEPTQRVSSLIIVQKKSGALRIGLDPSNMNKTKEKQKRENTLSYQPDKKS